MYYYNARQENKGTHHHSSNESRGQTDQSWPALLNKAHCCQHNGHNHHRRPWLKSRVHYSDSRHGGRLSSHHNILYS